MDDVQTNLTWSVRVCTQKNLNKLSVVYRQMNLMQSGLAYDDDDDVVDVVDIQMNLRMMPKVVEEKTRRQKNVPRARLYLWWWRWV